jgi:hypothetical protein
MVQTRGTGAEVLSHRLFEIKPMNGTNNFSYNFEILQSYYQDYTAIAKDWILYVGLWMKYLMWAAHFENKLILMGG